MIKKISIGQLIAAVAILSYAAAAGQISIIVSLLLSAIALFGIVGLAKNLPHRVAQIDRWIQILVQPWILSLSWGLLVKTVLLWNQVAVFILLSLLYMILLLPFAKNYCATFQAPLSRLFAVIWPFQIAIAPLSYWGLSSAQPSYLLSCIETGFLGALAYLIIILFLQNTWGYGFPFNLAKRHDGFNIGVAFVLLFLVYLLCSTPLDQDIWSHLSTQTQLRYILIALEAGIGEEILCRGAIFTCLYDFFRRQRYAVELAMLSSSLLFGLFHLFNLTRQPLMPTLYQVIMTLISGIFLSIFYLYSGQLWLVMLIHFYTDWVSFTNSTSETINRIGFTEWNNLLWLGLLAALLLIWLSFGKRAKVIRLHADRLIKADKEQRAA